MKFQVVIAFRESRNIYWVQEEVDSDAFGVLQSELSNNCDKYPNIQPEVGLICGSYFEGEW